MAPPWEKYSQQAPPAKNIGAPIDMNRPKLQNDDGSFSTEETITIDMNGKFFNIPTIVNGERVDEDKAIKLFELGYNKPVGEFGSLEEAVRAAESRTDEIGRVRGATAGGPAPWEKYKAAPADGTPKKQNIGEKVAAGAGKVASSALFGFGDEIAGAVSAPILMARGAAAGVPVNLENIGKAYKAGAEKWRGEDERFQEDHPILGTSLEIAGAIGGGGAAAAKLGGKALPRAFAAAPVKTAAKLGALEGAAFGAGEAEGGLIERIKGAGWGSVKGALTGAAIGKLTPAVMGLAKKVPGAVGALGKMAKGEKLSGAEDKAMDRLMKILDNMGVKPEEAFERATESVKNALPDKNLMAVVDAADEIPGATAALARAAKGEALEAGEAEAIEKLQATLIERGFDAEDMISKTVEGLGNNPNNEMVFDALGEPGVSLAQGAVLRGTEPAQKGLAAIRARAEKSFDSANQIVSEAFSGKNFKRSIEGFVKNLKSNAEDAYGKAHKIEIPAQFYRDQLAPFVEANKEALRHAVKIARAHSGKGGEFRADYQQLVNALQDKGATTLSSRAMSRFLEGLSDVRSKAWREGNRHLYSALRQSEDDFLEKLKEVNPELLLAREQFAGDSRIIDAAKFGREIFSSKFDPEDIADAFKGFTAGEREAAIIGIARAARDKASKASIDGNAATRFFRNRDMRERFRAVFPDDESYNRFASRLDSLIKQGKSNVRIDPAENSASAGRLAGAAQLEGGNLVEAGVDVGVDMMTTGGARTGIKGFRALAQKLSDDTKEQTEIARILFETPAELRPRLIRFLERKKAAQNNIAPRTQVGTTSAAAQLEN